MNTQGVAYEDITRILPPGVSILIVSFITLLCVMAFEKRRPAGLAFFIQFSLLASAILVTFLRSYWTALIVAIIVLFWIVESSARPEIAWLEPDCCCIDSCHYSASVWLF
ncbi:hypothetical protein [Candidatus Villigracilis affinis]|uniref:hypothetical protein n=1 Tax=Candidatus Villigracilis affinis TaxID=3140682 RepID=UPI002A226304|nr:hypothetical protein [Anaerolineales bacterium]